MDLEEARDYIARFEVECGLAGSGVRHISALELMWPTVDEDARMDLMASMVKRVLTITEHQNPSRDRQLLSGIANGLLYGVIIGVAMERDRVSVTIGDDELAFLESIEPEEDPSES